MKQGNFFFLFGVFAEITILFFLLRLYARPKFKTDESYAQSGYNTWKCMGPIQLDLYTSLLCVDTSKVWFKGQRHVLSFSKLIERLLSSHLYIDLEMQSRAGQQAKHRNKSDCSSVFFFSKRAWILAAFTSIFVGRAHEKRGTREGC